MTILDKLTSEYLSAYMVIGTTEALYAVLSRDQLILDIKEAINSGSVTHKDVVAYFKDLTNRLSENYYGVTLQLAALVVSYPHNDLIMALSDHAGLGVACRVANVLKREAETDS